MDARTVLLAAFTAGNLALSGALATPAAAQEQVVRIYNWSDYIDPQVLADFTAKTGIKTVYDTYDSNEILETKLLAGKTGYDVVVPSGSFLGRQLKANIFLPLDRGKLPNWSNLDPSLLAQAAKYDAGNAHSFVYMWGTTGIAYNVAKVRERLGDVPVDSWSVLLDPANAAKLKDCGIYMLDSPEDIFANTLNYIGEDPDSKDVKVIQKAADTLAKVRPSIRKFHSSETINALANGDICIAVMYSGDAGIAKTRAEESGNGVEINYVIPKEGALLWVDMMAIPKDAPHADNALAFMNYLMEPEVIAKVSNFVTYPSGNAKGMELVDDEVKSNPNLFPPEELRSKLFLVTPMDLKTQRAANRIWTSLTKGG